MATLFKFVLNPQQLTLEIHFSLNASTQKTIALSYEYLRIFSPAEINKATTKNSHNPIPDVFHKKSITIIAIEPLGKHGHRIVFDDGHQDVYSDEVWFDLSKHFEQRWAEYLTHLSSTNSRESTIDIKSVT